MNNNTNTNNYTITYKLHDKIITKNYSDITPETLDKYISLYTSLSGSTLDNIQKL